MRLVGMVLNDIKYIVRGPNSPRRPRLSCAIARTI